MGVAGKELRVPTRQEWQAARDKAGGKAGMVKGVDIGPLLDAYHKAMANPSIIVATRNATANTFALMSGLKKYRANPTVAKTLQLRDTVDEMIKAVDQRIRTGAEAERRLTELSKRLADVEKIAQLVAAGLSLVEYKHLKTRANEVGTAFRQLTDKDATVDDLYHKWLNITGRRLSAGGSDANPEEINKTRESAQVIGALATKMLAELKAKQLIA